MCTGAAPKTHFTHTRSSPLVAHCANRSASAPLRCSAPRVYTTHGPHLDQIGTGRQTQRQTRCRHGGPRTPFLLLTSTVAVMGGGISRATGAASGLPAAAARAGSGSCAGDTPSSVSVSLPPASTCCSCCCCCRVGLGGGVCFAGWAPRGGRVRVLRWSAARAEAGGSTSVVQSLQGRFFRRLVLTGR